MEHLTIRVEGVMKQRIDKLLEEKLQDKFIAISGIRLTQSDIIRMALHVGLNFLEKGGKLLMDEKQEKSSAKK